MPSYIPPPMNRRIKVRNTADRPASMTDEIGRPTTTQTWGEPLWANRRDQSPFTQLDEGVEVISSGRTIWTIRYKSDISADAEVVDSDDVVWSLVGSPVERGGANGYMAQMYLELHTERRSAQRTA